MLQVTILGNGAGGPFQGRNYTAQLVRSERDVFLVDCGEGAQQQLFRLHARYDALDHIFISHLHGDHVFGLAGMLTSFGLRRRVETLTIWGPEGLRELVETTARLCGVRFPFPLSVQEVDTSRHAMVMENPRLEVWTIPLLHRTLCTGWLFKEKKRPLNIRKEQIEAYNIPYNQIPAIKNGADLVLPDGVVVPNAALTLPPAAPRAYAFCSDTAPSEAVAAAVKGASLLYHEATFTDEHLEEALASGHSTASQAAAIAAQAGVETLLLGHFSSRYKTLERHLAEAQAVFPHTMLSEEGHTYKA